MMANWLAGIPLVALSACPAAILAQDIEPRAYSNAPVDMNFLIAGFALTDGDVSVDPAIPLEDADVQTTSAVLAYVRTLDMWGHLGKIAAFLPYSFADGSAAFQGSPGAREVEGLGDARIRLTIGLVGSPALSLKEFRHYQQDTIIGASIEVSMPTGQYDPGKLLNVGTNRWSIRPEIGVSKAFGPLTAEMALGAAFFTDNDEFFNGRTREQDPIYSAQAHLIYSAPSGAWYALTGRYLSGGQTRVDGVRSDDRQRKTRVGATVAFPIDRHHSVKLYATTGVSSRVGGEFDLFGAAWQYRWGAGL